MSTSGKPYLTGKFRHNLDDKNRLTIPSAWRSMFDKETTFLAIPNPGGEPVLTAGNPVKMSAMSEGPDTAPPTLGQDTDDVLRTELGLDDDELEALRADGVIG